MEKVRPGVSPGQKNGSPHPAKLCLALVVIAAACTPVGPDFVKPDLDAPPDWAQTPAQGLEASPYELVEWWQVFNDPVLNQLVETAQRQNNNIEIAGLRVLQARAQLAIAVGTQYPQSQFAQGSATYISPPDNSGVTSNYWQYGLSANVAWELDFWGRFRRGIESADAAFLASIAAYDQAMVLLVAAVTDVYAIIRTIEQQLEIAEYNVNIQQRSYDIAAVLFKNGSNSELDMQQANTLLLATKATIPDLQIALTQSKNALSTLLGLPPGGTDEMLGESRAIPTLPDSIAIGVPADMLRRRPDVRQAELLAMAQNALVGLAEADLYPSFSLIGSIGVAAGGPGSNASFGDLFDSDALTFATGPSIVWPFLNYGRIRNNVRVQDALLQQALVNYRETVLQAARETEDAMAGFIGTREQTGILAKTVTSAKRSNDLSTLRYKEGFSDYQRVLDAQQALFTQQQRYVAAQGETVRSLIAVYKALGGGWENRSNWPLISPATKEVMQERTNWGDLLDEDPRQTNSE